MRKRGREERGAGWAAGPGQGVKRSARPCGGERKEKGVGPAGPLRKKRKRKGELGRAKRRKNEREKEMHSNTYLNSK
jgi:hypothetical protein